MKKGFLIIIQNPDAIKEKMDELDYVKVNLGPICKIKI